MRFIFTTIFVLILFVDNSTLLAQSLKYQIHSHVIDSSTGLCIPNVSMSIVGSSFGAITHQNGEFSLIVTRIPAVLYFSHIGNRIGSYEIERKGEKDDSRIRLEPEIEMVEEDANRNESAIKVIRGDTLNIIDYEISNDKIFLCASLYRNSRDLRIVLTNLNGDFINQIPVKRAGEKIKFPEDQVPRMEYLMKDFTGQVQFLDDRAAHEIMCRNRKLEFGFDTPYPDFLERVIPVKAEMRGNLVFQIANQSDNYTWYFGPGTRNGKMIKRVIRNKSDTESVTNELLASAPGEAEYSKNLQAPLFRKGNELFVFDFYSNHIEVFDSKLKSNRLISISFHLAKASEELLADQEGGDLNKFPSILYDSKAGKAYAFFRIGADNRQLLKEINLETGQIDRIIEISGFSIVSNIRIEDNVVYFLYDTKVYPFYRLLYRMAI